MNSHFEKHQTFKILSSLIKKHAGPNRYIKNKQQQKYCKWPINCLKNEISQSSSFIPYMAFSYFLYRTQHTIIRIMDSKNLWTKKKKQVLLNEVLQQQSKEQPNTTKKKLKLSFVFCFPWAFPATKQTRTPKNNSKTGNKSRTLANSNFIFFPLKSQLCEHQNQAKTSSAQPQSKP